ncbi:hypothetical protein VTO42DRAFT_6861 [Malbranchea cinnamomea]
MVLGRPWGRPFIPLMMWALGARSGLRVHGFGVWLFLPQICTVSVPFQSSPLLPPHERVLDNFVKAITFGTSRSGDIPQKTQCEDDTLSAKYYHDTRAELLLSLPLSNGRAKHPIRKSHRGT